jgi:hypothetical protein
MGKKTETSKREGIDDEIESLRMLIKEAVELKTSATSLIEQTKLLSTVSKATLALSRSLKLKCELDQIKGSPAEMLRDALLELEEEWPEFKKLVSKYYPENQESAE